MKVVGIVLIVLGLAFVLLGAAAAARAVFARAAKPGKQGLGDGFDPSKWADLIKALTAAPQWLALSAVGAGLVAWGTTLLD